MIEPEISVIIPIFNEEECLPELLRRMDAAMEGLGRPCEIICINDGSRDGSLQLLKAASALNPSLKILDFNRNYGQHAAVFAGFEAARGEIIVTLDADLQNPPEEIPKLVAKMDEGYDVVGSVRQQRQDSLFRKAASRIINRITAKATGVQLHDYGCMLRAYRKGVVKALCESKEISTFIPVLADLFAGRITEIPVAHAERAKGKSKYSFLKLVRLEFDLITSFSLLPLRGTMLIGLVTAAVAVSAALVLIAGRVAYGPEWAVSGLSTLFAALFFFMGVLLFSIGLLGEYVGRIYMEVRRRPRFVIRNVITGGKERHP